MAPVTLARDEGMTVAMGMVCVRVTVVDSVEHSSMEVEASALESEGMARMLDEVWAG